MEILTQVETAIQFFYTLAGVTVGSPVVGTTVEETHPTIFVGDEVYFFDDETKTWGCGTFEGFYCDLHPNKETSPYWHEHMQGIQRVRIRETLTGGIVRPNYALPDNVYAMGEFPLSRAN